MLLNLHTHIFANKASEREIFNLITPSETEELEDFAKEIKEIFWYSLGIHPWYIHPENYKEQVGFLRKVANNQAVKLIGECGLDRLRGASLKLQEEVFIEQIHIAEDVKKPLIIHCVKCFNELISIKKIIRPKVPMIIHGFNQNIQIATQLLEKEFYLSFGTAILHQNSNAAKVLKTIPLEKLFLETDDKEVDIRTIYEHCAEILGITIEDLEEIVFGNYLNLSLV